MLAETARRDFLDWLTHERRASPLTVEAYGRDLGFFLGFLTGHLGGEPDLAARCRRVAGGGFAGMAGAPGRRGRGERDAVHYHLVGGARLSSAGWPGTERQTTRRSRCWWRHGRKSRCRKR